MTKRRKKEILKKVLFYYFGVFALSLLGLGALAILAMLFYYFGVFALSLLGPGALAILASMFG